MASRRNKSRKKFLIICSVIFLLLFLIMAATMVTLYFTILKPKQPDMVQHPVTLQGFNITSLLPPIINVKLGVTVTVDNQNYGSFTYDNGTTYVAYRGTSVAEAPIKSDTLPARAKHNISTTVDLSADKLALNPGFLGDVLVGVFNVTSSTTLHGQVKLWKFFKTKATTYSSCDISLNVKNQSADSVCKQKIKF